MSGLRGRLAQLRGDAPAGAEEVVCVADNGLHDRPSLAARLRRLGGHRQLGAAPSAPRPVPTARRNGCVIGAPDEAALVIALGAERLSPGVLRRTRLHPLALRHGSAALQPDAAAVRLLLPGAPRRPSGWCVIDTETSGLAGGTGTWVFMVGLARWQSDGLLLSQFLLTRLDAEAAFLEHVIAALDGVELLLSYNGKGFDLPLLAARFRLAARADPTAQLAHLDLLHPIRRAFATRWPDCRLATVERRLLGHARRGDLPGAEAPAAWLAWLRAGDGSRLAAVLAHNAVDLLSVAALPAPLAHVHQAPARAGADPLRIARWWLRSGDIETARRLLAALSPQLLDTPARQLLARLHARAQDWPGALLLWEQLAAAGDTDAQAALAKHFEHRARDPLRALAYARGLPDDAATDRRCKRLAHKIALACR
jgi:hypothetical protein